MTGPDGPSPARDNNVATRMVRVLRSSVAGSFSQPGNWEELQ